MHGMEADPRCSVTRGWCARLPRFSCWNTTAPASAARMSISGTPNLLLWWMWERALGARVPGIESIHPLVMSIGLTLCWRYSHIPLHWQSHK